MASLAAITGRTTGTIRKMQNEAATPWDDDLFEKGKNRRYTGYHALTLVIAEMLALQGLSAAQASEVTLIQRANIETFLDEIEAGGPITARFVACISRARTRDHPIFTGLSWVPMMYWGYGTAEELRDVIASQITDDVTDLSNGPHVAAAPMASAYRILKGRAEAAGFLIDGRRILRLAQDTTD
jgi:hypothetical protein